MTAIMSINAIAHTHSIELIKPGPVLATLIHSVFTAYKYRALSEYRIISLGTRNYLSHIYLHTAAGDSSSSFPLYRINRDARDLRLTAL